jgi:hypothetical protein
MFWMILKLLALFFVLMHFVDSANETMKISHHFSSHENKTTVSKTSLRKNIFAKSPSSVSSGNSSVYSQQTQPVTSSSNYGNASTTSFNTISSSRNVNNNSVINMQLIDLSVCVKPEACTKKTLPTHEFVSSAIVDVKRRIIMEYSPKADSTSAIAMFFEEMGFHYGKQYKGFVHIFRGEFFNRKCYGQPTPCMYIDSNNAENKKKPSKKGKTEEKKKENNYFRFKITRNPYDRAVSSYVHCLRTGLLHKSYTKAQSEDLSFYDYLLHLKSLSFSTFKDYAGSHAGLQGTLYEWDLFQKKTPLFHEIVHAEDPLPSLIRINQQKGTNYTLGFSSTHYAKRTNTFKDKFIGKEKWKEIKNNIPKDYGLFYNEEIKQLVESLYSVDLQMYGYSFPFEFPPIAPSPASPTSPTLLNESVPINTNASITLR